jgi:hypothetical protein
MSGIRSMSWMLALGLTGLSAGASQQQDSLFTLLPHTDTLEEWSQADTARVYCGIDLFTFIDGGAELFLEYGFRKIVAVEYERQRAASINIEIYEMNDPEAAYGIYSVRSGSEGNLLAIGNEGRVHPYYIMFWKGRFYVTVAASDTSEECKRGIEKIAREVDRRITESGPPPRIVGILPKKGALKQRFVRGYLGLVADRILDLRELFPIAEGAVGTYKNHTLLLVRYQNSDTALIRMNQITHALKSTRKHKRFRSIAGVTSIVVANDQTLCLTRQESYIVCSLSALDSVARRTCHSMVVTLRKEAHVR